MSADLPLEEPSRRLSEPAGARDSDVWDRGFLPWDVYFAVVWVATLVFTLGASSPGEPVRMIAAALFVLPAPWYVWVGRAELLRQGVDERCALRYIGGAVLLFLAPAILVGETLIATFALVPQCFMVLRLRLALAR